MWTSYLIPIMRYFVKNAPLSPKAGTSDGRGLGGGGLQRRVPIGEGGWPLTGGGRKRYSLPAFLGILLRKSTCRPAVRSSLRVGSSCFSWPALLGWGMHSNGGPWERGGMWLGVSPEDLILTTMAKLPFGWATVGTENIWVGFQSAFIRVHPWQ